MAGLGMLRGMELRVLRYFVAAAREGSVTAASRLLHVTQPTLSRQLRELENELGQRLFVRSSHRLRLTQEGTFLLKRAETLIALADRTAADFRGMRGAEPVGTVAFGCAETRAMHPVAAVMRRVRERHPGVDYRVVSASAEDTLADLECGLLDFGIVIQPTDISGYESLPLPFRNRWGLLVPAGDPAFGGSVAREALSGLPLICPRAVARAAAGGGSPSFRAWFGDLLPRLNVVATCNLAYNAAVLAAQGLGCALTLEGLVGRDCFPGLRFVPLAPALESKTHLIWKRHQRLTPAAAAFLEACEAGIAPADA